MPGKNYGPKKPQMAAPKKKKKGGKKTK